jgi:signal transduction histidine kinase/GAF domain-containing protein
VGETFGDIISLTRLDQASFQGWLLAIVADLQRADSLESCLDLALQGLEDLVDYDAAALSFSDQGQMTTAAVRSGFDLQDSASPLSFPLDQHPYYQASDRFTAPITGQEPVEESPWLMLSGVGTVASWMLVPLWVEAEFIGQISLCKREPDAYSAHEEGFVEAFAAHVAIALRNKRTIKRARQRAKALEMQDTYLRSLLGTVRDLSVELDIETLFRRVVQRAAQVVPDAERAWFLVHRDRQLLCWNAMGDREPDCAEVVVPACLIQKAFRRLCVLPQSQSQCQKAGPLDPTWLCALQGQLPAGVAPSCKESRLLLVPIKVADEFLGALLFENRTIPDAFGSIAQEIARLFATQVGIAFANARLYNVVCQYATTLETRVDERTAEIRREKERTEAVLQSVADGVVVTDLQGRIVERNPTAEQWLCYKLEDRVLPNARLRRFIQRLAMNPHQTGPAVIEFPVYPQDQGDISTCQDFMRCKGEDCPLYAQRELPCWMAVSRQACPDDTGCHSGDCKDCAFYAQLDRMTLQARAAPIAEKGQEPIGSVIVLRDISKLRELDRLKSQFVSNVSHELRTPLSNIKLYLSLVERGRSDKREHYLDIIGTETERLRKLIEDLLDLSRLENGRHHAVHTVQHWRSVVSQVLESWRPRLENKRLGLKAEWGRRVAPVYADRNQMIQVFTNLLSNAINYTEPGGHIQVQTRSVKDKDGEWTALTVQDDGLGISEADRAHIFDRFYRGAAEGMGIPGTGLGLTIVKEIVELHGGRIQVESEPCVGSAFTVYLPAWREP